MNIRTLGVAAALAATVTLPFAAQERINTDINARIREEGMNKSQVMRTLHFLADVYGPRVTGTPSLKAAGEWAIKTMEGWGMKNGRLEPWDFGRPGWSNELAWGAVTSPVKDSLVFEVLAWTPSTKGTVKAHAVNISLPEQPTDAELTAFFKETGPLVKGAIVLVGKPRFVPVNITPPAKRRADEDVKAQYDPNNPGGGRGRGGRGAGRGAAAPAKEGALPARDVAKRVDEFLLTGGALVRINDAGREHGQIVAFNNASYDVATSVPTVVLRNEDYGRIARILADSTPVEMTFTIVNKVYPEGKTSYNTIAEIPGSDKADEVVMLGGHLDSWHSATGATDNAIGCAIMMEAARILKTLGVQPRRTIRVALWSGEEEGLLGSLAYVKSHFGSFEAQKPEWSKLVAYLNIDTGTGKLRGAGVFGPPVAAKTVREILAPFEDLGIYGASAGTSRATGGTDSTSFNNAGLPGIGFQQDPIEYNSHTHHTNLDTYERVIEDDVKKAAVIVASSIYHLSMRDQMLERFAPADMPAPPPQRGSGSGQ